MGKTVVVSEGILEGELLKNNICGEYYSFKGIPYAEPPVGSTTKKYWNGIRKATEFGPICYQYHVFAKGVPPNSSEDCLYLNVYSPAIKPNKPLPVMVCIHGGGFVMGSGNDDIQGPSFILKQDVILVTFNYRLEVLGFLCLETEDIPGNAGMKDQVAALRWVQKNIKSFGGDPTNITIFGSSAGGCSVSYHLVSEMSKGLFKRAIPQSGTCIAGWATQTYPRQRAQVLAKKLGCDSENDKELYEFFKRQPLENLVHQQTPLSYAEAATQKPNLVFTIVDEKKFGNNERFFHGDTYDVLREKGIHDDVEVLAGYTEDEGTVSLFGVTDAEKMLSEGNNYFEFFAPTHMRFKASVEKQIEFGKQVKQRYLGNKKAGVETADNYFKSFAAELFVVPCIQQARFISRKNKTFLYKFTCKSERNVVSATLGATKLVPNKVFAGHGDDGLYLFDSSFLGNEIKPETQKLIDKSVKLWTNFAKFGELTPDDSLGIRCSPYTLTEQEYLDIGNQLVIKHKPHDEEFEFWEDLYRKYYPKCISVIHNV